MPAGKVVGRISIKVLPDTDDFREKLRNDLKKIQNSTQLNVRLGLDRKSVRETSRDLNRWTRKNKQKVDVGLDLNGAGMRVASARLDWLARHRRAEILPVVNKAAAGKAAAQMATLLAAFSGGRIVKSWSKSMIDAFKNLDKAIPMIALMGNALGALSISLLTSVSNLFALSSALASIGAVALTLPATFAAAAIGVTVLWVALKDIKTKLPEIVSAWQGMKKLISDNFWNAALEPMRAFVDGVLPLFTAGMGKAGTALGGFFGALATGLNGSLAGPITGMFDQLAAAIKISEGAAAPLASSIAAIGAAGSAYLPKMAEWVVKIATQFNDWLTGAIKDGSFDQWVQNGIAALHDLGQVIKGVASILSGIADAANAAGGSSLGMFADTLKQVAAVVNGPAFQTGLIAAFKGAHDAISAITTGAGPTLANFFATLGNSLGTLLPIIGNGLGTALGAIANGLTRMLSTGGVDVMFNGIAQAFAAMAPAMGPLGVALGMIAKLIGQFAVSVGPVLGSLLTTVAQAAMALLPALTPVITMLSGGLMQVMTMLAPIIVQIARLLGPILVQAVQALMPALMPLLAVLGPVLMSVLQAVAPVLGILANVIGTILVQAVTALAPVLTMVGQVIAQLAPFVGQLLQAILPLIGPLLQLVVAILTPLLDVVMAIISAALPPLIAAFQLLVSAILPVLNILIQVVTWIMGMLAPVLTWLGELIVGAVTGIINGLTDVFSSVTGIFEGFKTMFSGGIGNFFKGLGQILLGFGQLIWGIIQVVWNLGVVKAFSAGFALIKGIFTKGFGLIKGIFSAGVNWIKTVWSLFLGALKNKPKAAIAELKALFSMLWSSLKSKAVEGWNAIKGAFSRGISGVVSNIKGLPGRIKSAFGDALGLLKGVGKAVIQGFINGISSMFDNVKGKLGELTSKLTDWKGPEPVDRVLLFGAGQLIIQGLVNGLESKYASVRRSLRGLTADIARTEIASPTIADPRLPSAGTVDAALALAGGAPAPVTDIDINLHGSGVTAEDVAQELLFTTRRIERGGLYARKV